MYKIQANFSMDPMVLKSDISYLFSILDEKVPELIEDIYLKVYDKGSALNAKKFYDKSWFLSQKISTESKIKIAKILKNLGEKFGVDSLIWKGISEMEPEIIKDIDILENKE